MKTYKGMSRTELIEKIVEARVEQCKKQNLEKFGNNDYSRQNENAENWRKLIKTYPMTSKNGYSLQNQYDYFYGALI